jgi:NAD-dependent SIR2 family protein deacetylase
MAAQYVYCIQCHKKYPTHLFDTRYDFSKMAPEECPACSGTRELHVNLDFQLGAGERDFKVVSAHLPEELESWLGEGTKK